MELDFPAATFEYDCGDATALTLPHCTGWRTVPATVCVGPVDAVSRIEFEGGPVYEVAAPDAFIVPRDLRHRITLVAGGTPVSIWCHFRINLFHGIDLLRFYRLPRVFTGTAAAALREHTLALHAAYRGEVGPERLFLRQREGFELVKTILDASTVRDDADREMASFSRIGPALRFMRERLGRPVTLAAMAGTVNLSPSRFSGLFREIVGEAPVAYYQRLRLRQAQSLLLSSSRSIGEIAEQLGFFDVYHFSHKFKRLAGVSPREYRVRLRRSLFPEKIPPT